MKAFALIIGSVVVIAAIVIGLGFADIGLKKLFLPMHENVRREVFENTKSYVHGKIQDLAKYYREYQTSDDRAAIEALVRSQFAEFDEAHIQVLELRQFLVKVRGY
jgi:hypothetical protein